VPVPATVNPFEVSLPDRGLFPPRNPFSMMFVHTPQRSGSQLGPWSGLPKIAKRLLSRLTKGAATGILHVVRGRARPLLAAPAHLLLAGFDRRAINSRFMHRLPTAHDPLSGSTLALGTALHAPLLTSVRQAFARLQLPLASHLIAW
jgi:hypothetical protein